MSGLMIDASPPKVPLTVGVGGTNWRSIQKHLHRKEIVKINLIDFLILLAVASFVGYAVARWFMGC